MKITAFDLVRLLHEVERVSASKIPNEQKTKVLTELKNAVPEPVFCGAGLATREYVLEIIQGALNGCAETTKSQVPVKKGTRAVSTKCPESELLRNSDEDTRGPGFETTMVKKTAQKRRAAKRSA